MKKFILTITLNPAVDKIMYLKKTSSLKDNLSESEEVVSAGGKGINVSRALKKLGVPTLATGFQGGETGALIVKLLSKEKIPNQFVPIQGYSRVNVTLVEERSGQSTRVLSPGPRIISGEIARFKADYKKLLPNVSFVVLSGRNVQGTKSDLYRELIEIAAKKNVKCLLDTSGDSLRQAISARPFIIKPNREEAQELLEYSLTTSDKLKKACQEFHRLGAVIVLISLGKDGAIASEYGSVFLAKAPSVKTINEVGCGDSFVAGFLSSYLKNKPLPLCLKMGVSCGTASTFNIVPADLKNSVVRKIFSKIKVKSL